VYKYLSFLLIVSSCMAQQPQIAASSNAMASVTSSKPKLVVGIVVDQMRYEYLNRFQEKYGQDGFKRLMREGFNCKNNQYHYASTVTGPGHAHVYTGSVPALSGIVGNEWYDKVDRKGEYVVSDTTVTTVGDGSERAGKMSPVNLKVTTITDQLRIATQFGSKVVGVAIKDRGAILPAGHTGDAYWFDSSTGNWITSSFYGDDLKPWAKAFNDKNVAQEYTKIAWEPLLPIESYTESEADDQPYENRISGERKPVFPHTIKLGSLVSTPWGNTLTLDFALEALKNEELGKDDVTDFLAISFSSPDYVGHAFGPQSKEVEDIYLRLDLEIARLLNTLDEEVGEENYTVFLTADHGVAEIPAFLKKHDMAAGLMLTSEMENPIAEILKEKLGKGDWILDASNYQLYLNRQLMADKKVSVSEIHELISAKLELMDGVYRVVNLENFNASDVPPYFASKIQNLYNPKRSGELLILLEPGWFVGYNTRGTTHGTMYAYDSHVPLIWYGNGIKKGETVEPTYISDIAPTLSQLLGILEPNGNVGQPIKAVLK
jgi:predicted AlkP superfamily pyrophosphatase or phosphodiesterase